MCLDCLARCAITVTVEAVPVPRQLDVSSGLLEHRKPVVGRDDAAAMRQCSARHHHRNGTISVASGESYGRSSASG
jgi:hypothetical protein